MTAMGKERAIEARGSGGDGCGREGRKRGESMIHGVVRAPRGSSVTRAPRPLRDLGGDWGVMSGRVREEGRKPIGEKKTGAGAWYRGSTGMRDDFSLPSSPVKHLVVGPKVGVCEVGMGASFGEDYFNCHGSL